MYGFSEYTDVTPEQLLSQVNQLEVFGLVFGQKININAQYISPFRKDKRPGCHFELMNNGHLLFVDFSEPKDKRNRSCIAAIMDIKQIGLQSAIQFICENFKLSKKKIDYTSAGIYNKTSESFTKTDFHIEYTPKIYHSTNIAYWSSFYISLNDLKEDNIFCVKSFTTKSYKGIFKFTTYNHCYAIDFIDAVKIYQPYKNDRGKWITNCNENHIGNIDNLPKIGKELIVAKSYKDHRILRNTIKGSNIIWFQNEGCVPDYFILKNLVERFDTIIIFFDNDKTGIEAAYRLKQIFNSIRRGCARVVFLPKRRKHKELYNRFLKDPGEFISKEGKTDFIKILKTIGL